MSILWQAIIVVVVAWIITTYLLPLLPGALSTLVFIVLVLAIIYWLLRIAGLV